MLAQKGGQFLGYLSVSSESSAGTVPSFDGIDSKVYRPHVGGNGRMAWRLLGDVGLPTLETVPDTVFSPPPGDEQ